MRFYGSSAVPGFVARLALGLLSWMLAGSASADEKSPTRTDAFGDPLPAGAIARLGTVRLRHADYLRSIGFTSDGKTLISMGRDGVRVWEAATGKPVRHFGTGVLPNTVALSPDGRRIALNRSLAGDRSAVEVWDTMSGKLLHKLGDRYYQRICFSPDSKRLAALADGLFLFQAADDNSPWHIDIWNVATGKRESQLTGPSENVQSMRFSHDGKTLLVGGLGKFISIRDAATGKEVRRLRDLPAAVHSLALSPRGDRVAFIEFWMKKDAQGGIRYGPGTRLFLVDLHSGAEVRRWETSSNAEPNDKGWWESVFSPDGRKLAACAGDGPIHVWDTETGRETRLFPDGRTHSGGMAFSPDGKTLAVGDSGRVIRLLDAHNGADRLTMKSPRNAVTALAVALDGRALFTAADGIIHRWDPRTGRELDRLIGHKAFITALALPADARTLYSTSRDQTLRVWNLATGTARRFREDRCSPLACLALSSDGALLAFPAGIDHKEFLLLQTASGKRLPKLTTKGFILALAFPPEATIVRALTADGNDLLVQSWETATGRSLPDFKLPSDPKTTNSPTASEVRVALSPDGKRVAHSDADKVLRVLDVDARRVVYHWTRLPSSVSAIAFAADGRTFAWAEESGILHWLETATWKERQRLPGHTGAITALAFSGDGRLLLSGSEDTTALVWDLLGNEPPKLSAEERDACWTALADKDAAKAYRAMCRLIAAPVEALALLRSRLKAVAGVDEKDIARRIADLDAEEFPVREKATEVLRELGELAEPACRKALTARPTLEMRRRLQGLLDDITQRQWRPSPELSRQIRAIEVLERIGTPEACTLLEALARGAAGARQTRDAQAAVQRLHCHRGDKS